MNKYSVNISRNLSLNVVVNASSEEEAQNIAWANIEEGKYEDAMLELLKNADPSDDEIGNIIEE